MSRSRSRSKSKTKRSPSRGESKERDAKKVGCSLVPVTGGQKEIQIAVRAKRSSIEDLVLMKTKLLN